MMPLPWKIGATLALLGVLTLCGTAAYHHIDQGGYDRAVTERAARDSSAVFQRVQDNAVLSIKQDAINAILTKAKNEELAPVVQRIYVERVRVGAASCGGSPAATEAKDAAGSDRTDPPGRLVRADVERDTRALTEAVELDLATGRACQAWGKENGFIP